ncbi:MAG: hypothetical protein ACI89S_000996, partial [Gammaproteobacteria bacterium]
EFIEQVNRNLNENLFQLELTDETKKWNSCSGQSI